MTENISPPIDRANGRTKRFKRRSKTGAIHEVAVTPEALAVRHEQYVKTLAAPSRRSCPVLSDGLPITHWADARTLRSRKARGHILAIWKLTGESPNDIMDRLGLTDEEKSHIHPFTQVTIWR